MARFYVGQPVVCVRDREWWTNAHHGHVKYVPDKGAKYVVSRTGLGMNPQNQWMEAVGLREFPAFVAFDERGFEPITENQVQAIIAIATDVPDEITTREMEDV